MREQKLKKLLKDIDAVLVTSPHNLRYFTDFKGGEGVALIGKGAKHLFVDSRYTEEAKSEAKNFNIIEFGAGKRNAEILKYIKEYEIYSLGFEDGDVSVLEHISIKESFVGIEWQGCSEKLAELRMVKDEEELNWLRNAERIGVEAFESILPLLKVGTSETDIAAELEYQMRKRGSCGTSFETIVVSGSKSSMPHGRAGQKQIENGDFVTLDFGCRFNGYCSDMTRTVVVGKAGAEQKKIYETVLKAQLAGLDTIRAGILGSEVDFAARKVIDDAGYGKYFGHSLGHGVGLMIHELPNLSPASKICLKSGMVVTCEPGIYIPGFGGVRIEDMVCVTENGVENLTKLKKDLLEL